MDSHAAPHDLDAERHVLGAVMIDTSAITKAIPVIGPREVFFKRAYQLVWNAAVACSKADIPCDLFSVSTQLKKTGDFDRVGGTAALYEIQESTPSAANVAYYAEEVKEAYTRRQLIAAGTNMIDLAGQRERSLEEVMDGAQRILFDVHDTERRATLAVNPALQATIAHIEELFRRKDKLLGIPSGFTDLDEILFGLNPSDLMIVAARPSVGKSALAHAIMATLACTDEENPPGVLMFSLEMGTEQIMTRILSNVGRVHMARLRTGNIDQQDWRRLSAALGKLESGNVFINDQPGISLMEIRAEARRQKIETPSLGLVIVDYLQLMQGGSHKSGNREQEIAEYSRSLKELARELDVCVMALSQLNRGVENRPGDKRPLLNDLRESGAIEQDADIVLFLYSDELYDPDTADVGVIELIVRKHRNGALGTVKVDFDSAYMRFSRHMEHP